MVSDLICYTLLNDPKNQLTIDPYIYINIRLLSHSNVFTKYLILLIDKEEK